MSNSNLDPEAPVIPAVRMKIKPWGAEPVPNDPLSNAVDGDDGDGRQVYDQSPFGVDDVVNTKIALWHGNVLELEVDAYVVPNNEMLTDRSGVVADVFDAAGQELLDELKLLDETATGNSIITAGYSCKASHLIHSISPRYNANYDVASQNALNSCYRSATQLALVHHLTTLAILPLHSEKRNYPAELGTLRKLLSLGVASQMDLIILCMPSKHYYDIYHSLMQIYFPRNQLECEIACRRLPSELGDDNAEILIKERAIRIDSMTSECDPSLDVKSMLSDKPEFAQYSEAVPDSTSQQKTKKEIQQEECAARYTRLLAEAKKSDLSSVTERGLVYDGGNDSLGRRVVVVVGKKFNVVDKTDLHHALLRIIFYLDTIADREYVFVYVHTSTTSDNHPSLSWLRSVHDSLHYKLKKNLKALYVIHATMWFKFASLCVSPFVSGKFWSKLKYIDNLPKMANFIPVAQLNLPSFVLDYDYSANTKIYQETMNGQRYYGNDFEHDDTVL